MSQTAAHGALMSIDLPQQERLFLTESLPEDNMKKFLLVAVALLVSATSASAQFTFNSLDFPGSTFTRGCGINNHGEIVGAYRLEPPRHAYLFKAANSLRWHHRQSWVRTPVRLTRIMIAATLLAFTKMTSVCMDFCYARVL